MPQNFELSAETIYKEKLEDESKRPLLFLKFKAGEITPGKSMPVYLATASKHTILSEPFAESIHLKVRENCLEETIMNGVTYKIHLIFFRLTEEGPWFSLKGYFPIGENPHSEELICYKDLADKVKIYMDESYIHLIQ